MNYVVTGAAGHVSKPLTELLLEQGHDVTVIGRNPRNLEGLVELGARTAIGDMADVPFLTKSFRGADGENFSTAIRATGVKSVVLQAENPRDADRRLRENLGRRLSPGRQVRLSKRQACQLAFRWNRPYSVIRLLPQRRNR